jgi:hypothetical protein
LYALLALTAGCGQWGAQPARGYNGDYEKGMNVFFMNSRNRYEERDFDSNMVRLRTNGINTVFLVPYHFSAHAHSDSIVATEETIDDSLLGRAIETVKNHGMEPILKPHIDLLDGEPRTSIAPANSPIWAGEYFAVLRRYAELSNHYDLGSFVVGTELDNVADRDFFHKIVGELRGIYGGRIIYAASFDHFLTSEIWDHVDVIGVNAYYNLCGSPRCNLSTLSESWNYWLTVLSEFGARRDMDLIITEVGFCSTRRTALNPGDWTIGKGLSMKEQAKSYRALLSQAGYFSGIKGIYWWQWELNGGGGTANTDYTPCGKPAERVIEEYWGL